MRTLNLLHDLSNVLRRNYSLPLAHALIRTHATDSYIVSFPPSSSTWLRTILAGLIEHKDQSFYHIGSTGQYMDCLHGKPYDTFMRMSGGALALLDYPS